MKKLQEENSELELENVEFKNKIEQLHEDIVRMTAAVFVIASLMDMATAKSCVGDGPFPTEEDVKTALLEV